MKRKPKKMGSSLMKCKICGCTNNDCRQCIEKTGLPCHWVGPNLCSACADPATLLKPRKKAKTAAPKEDPYKKLPFLILQNLFITDHLPAPIPEYEFRPGRKWRFDFAWPAQRVCLEVEGGIFGYRNKKGERVKGGAHSSVTGILRDIEKYNAAVMLGWRVIRVQPKQLHDVATIQMVKQLITTGLVYRAYTID